jgi:O-antigen ligase
MFIIMKLPAKSIPTLLPLGLIGALIICVPFGHTLDASARDRVVVWGFANSWLKAHPMQLLFGMGYNMFWQITSWYFTGMRGMTAHNAFVYCYTEIGLFGFIWWLGLIVTGLMGCWRTRLHLTRSIREEHPDYDYLWRFAGAAMISMIGFCASGYFLSRAFVYPMFFLMAIIGVVPLVTQEWYNYDKEPDDQIWLIEHPRTVWTLIPLAGVGGMIYVWLSCRALNLGM